MHHREGKRFWNANADAWTKLARAGYDVHRDHLNTPAFLAMLPDVRGLIGLDIGCGEGHNTRLLAQRGAHISALDIAEAFVHHTAGFQGQPEADIDYLIASAVELPFPASSFDFATAFMSLMDISETEMVLAETFRVLKAGTPGAAVRCGLIGQAPTMTAPWEVANSLI